MLRGAEGLMNTCKKHLGIAKDGTTKDGCFTLSEFECLGACVNAPVVQINDDYIEDVTPEALTQLLDDLRNGKPLTPHSCIGRKGSKPDDASKEGVA
jgi:NADH-quinone oxidoreductase subunit E